jgi:hypothetical protein
MRTKSLFLPSMRHAGVLDENTFPSSILAEPRQRGSSGSLMNTSARTGVTFTSNVAWKIGVWFTSLPEYRFSTLYS